MTDAEKIAHLKKLLRKYTIGGSWAGAWACLACGRDKSAGHDPACEIGKALDL